MNKTNFPKIGLGLVIAILSGLTGCIGYVDGPRHQTRVYAPAAPVYVETAVVVQDDYVYYPGYQVYYSGHTHQYVYLEGSAWVTRPAPPQVSVDVLVASPSVRVDFHDAPANHHTAVARTYPREWAPPGWSHGNKGNKKDKGDKRDKHGRD